MNMTIDELAKLLGQKEMEIYVLNRELEQMKAALKRLAEAQDKLKAQP